MAQSASSLMVPPSSNATPIIICPTKLDLAMLLLGKDTACMENAAISSTRNKPYKKPTKFYPDTEKYWEEAETVKADYFQS